MTDKTNALCTQLTLPVDPRVYFFVALPARQLARDAAQQRHSRPNPSLT